MAKNTLPLEQESSAKAKSSEKTFRIPISTGIFEHYPDMLDSIWLFMWYIDKTTEEHDGEGRVLGGMPIRDPLPASVLGVPLKTVRRWRGDLARNGYTRLLRTPYGYVITLLKSKKWNWKPVLVTKTPEPAKRDLPNGEIAAVRESARSGHSGLPNGAQRVPDPGSQSAQNGKYKEDRTETKQGQNSGQNSCSSTIAASPLRAKPSGRGKRQLGFAQTESQIARQMASWRDTVADHLAQLARSNYFVSGDKAKRRCGEAVDSFTLAFAAIGYPFDLSSSVLGWEFCENVKTVVEESRRELPRPKKWELCERVLDRCNKTWDDVEEYSDVGLPCWPSDFDDHITRLFEQEGR